MKAYLYTAYCVVKNPSRPVVIKRVVVADNEGRAQRLGWLAVTSPTCKVVFNDMEPWSKP